MIPLTRIGMADVDTVLLMERMSLSAAGPLFWQYFGRSVLTWTRIGTGILNLTRTRVRETVVEHGIQLSTHGRQFVAFDHFRWLPWPQRNSELPDHVRFHLAPSILPSMLHSGPQLARSDRWHFYQENRHMKIQRTLTELICRLSRKQNEGE